MRNSTPEEAAALVRHAVGERRVPSDADYATQMRQAELEVLKAQHRQRLEAKEREYLFLSKLPASAVLHVSLKKQTDAATVLQAFWRGKKARERVARLKSMPREEPKQRPPPRSFKPPPDSFYRPIDPEAHENIVKQIRMRGAGDLDQYLNEYSRFLDKQIAWEKLRKQKYCDRHEAKAIIRALSSIKGIEDTLTYRIDDATPEELAKARIIKNRKLPDPKRWWKNLADDDEWEMEVVGTNIVDQIQSWKLDFYQSRLMEFAGQ